MVLFKFHKQIFNSGTEQVHSKWFILALCCSHIVTPFIFIKKLPWPFLGVSSASFVRVTMADPGGCSRRQMISVCLHSAIITNGRARNMKRTARPPKKTNPPLSVQPEIFCRSKGCSLFTSPPRVCGKATMSKILSLHLVQFKIFFSYWTVWSCFALWTPKVYSYSTVNIV